MGFGGIGTNIEVNQLGWQPVLKNPSVHDGPDLR
jgi:hypothetical protein